MSLSDDTTHNTPTSDSSIPHSLASAGEIHLESRLATPTLRSISATESVKTNAHHYSHHKIEGGLLEHEYVWGDASDWLEKVGFKLRPRYRRDWVPSWLGAKDLNPYFCEDGRASCSPDMLDAVRVSDGRIVMLKRVRKSAYPHEETLLRFFSQQPHASDSRNHAVPLYDVLQWPDDNDVVFLVMPYLVPIQQVRFMAIREVLECFGQLLEGLQYMHHHDVAYKSGIIRNVMVNPTPLYLDLPHPVHAMRSYDFQWIAKQHSLTIRPSRFYFTNFGLACRFQHIPDPQSDTSLLRQWEMGCDPWPPEVTKRYDPFRADIYSLGRFFNRTFLQKSSSYEFLKPLVYDMMQADPAARPQIDALVKQFRELREFQLQSRMLDNRVTLLREDRLAFHLYKDDKYQQAAQKTGVGVQSGRISLSLSDLSP